MSETTFLGIDFDRRAITIPSGISSLGVESDDDVFRLHFSIPKFYGDNDLTEFDIRVHYVNAYGEGDVYEVTDATVYENDIMFSWLVGRFATISRGDIRFSISLVKIDENGEVIKRLGTTPATRPILEGLETSEAVIQDNPDIIENILFRIEGLERNGAGTGETGGNTGGGYYRPVMNGTVLHGWVPSDSDMPYITENIELQGPQGPAGKDGTSVTIESVILGIGSGATNTVIFSDGNRMTVQNGKDGARGPIGPAGADGWNGMPAMHSWDGTVLTVTSASGTSSADLKGESGVYVGTETPDNNANVWINPEGEASTEGVYELINTITLEGGESAVDITEDSAANVFALKAAFVKVETPASTDTGTGYIETFYGNQRISKHHISNIKQSSSTKVSKAEVMQRYGRWAEYTYGGAADGATSNLINIVQFTLEATVADLKYVDKVRVRVNGVTFDAGTKITVWGVRTNSSSGGNAEPIRITKQPVNANGQLNDTVYFTVEATGVATYQWQYRTANGTKWTDWASQTTATMTLSLTNEGRLTHVYRCKLTDADGNVLYTDEVLVTEPAAEPIRITKQPVDVTIAAGNTVVFSVEAEGEGLTYQWEYMTLTGSDWKNNTLEGNATATLTFKVQTYHDGYKYRCLITDAAGNTVRTNEVVLTLNAAS